MDENMSLQPLPGEYCLRESRKTGRRRRFLEQPRPLDQVNWRLKAGRPLHETPRDPPATDFRVLGQPLDIRNNEAAPAAHQRGAV